MAYIEREKVLEIAKDEYYSDFHKSMADLTSLKELLEDTPIADVVEVVRCKDCKYFIRNVFNQTACDRTFDVFGIGMLEDDFCSYGERKDEEWLIRNLLTKKLNLH